MRSIAIVVLFWSLLSWADADSDGWSSTGLRTGDVGDTCVLAWGGFPQSALAVTHSPSAAVELGGKMGLVSPMPRWRGRGALGTTWQAIVRFTPEGHRAPFLGEILGASFSFEPGVSVSLGADHATALLLPMMARVAFSTNRWSVELQLSARPLMHTATFAAELPLIAGVQFDLALSQRFLLFALAEGGLVVATDEPPRGHYQMSVGVGWRLMGDQDD